MFPWSVMPRAGWPSATAACTSSSTRAAPSSIENSVWVCRCVNDRVATWPAPSSMISSPLQGVLHRVWTSYSSVIPTIARRNAPRGVSRPGPGGRRAGSEVGAGSTYGRIAAARQRSLAHLVELGTGGDLLGHQGGLDPVEEALEPTDQLCMGDPELGIRRSGGVEGDRDAVQLRSQVGRQPVGQFPDRLLVDLAEPDPTGLVEWCLAHLVEQLLDHRPDAQQLGRPLDGLVLQLFALAFTSGRIAPRGPGLAGLAGGVAGGRQHPGRPVALDDLGTDGHGLDRIGVRRLVFHQRFSPPSATNGTSLSSRVNDPCRLARRLSPVSAGSTKAIGAWGIRATSPSRGRSTSSTGPSNQPSSMSRSRSITQVVSP